jgi:hypothetical protein
MAQYLVGPTDALFRLNQEIGIQLWASQYWHPIDPFCDYPEKRHHWFEEHGTKVGDETTARFRINEENAPYIPAGEYSYSYDLYNSSSPNPEDWWTPVHFEGACTFTVVELEEQDPEWYVAPGTTVGGDGLYSVAPVTEES